MSLNLNQLKSRSLSVAALILIIAFQNCSNSFQSISELYSVPTEAQTDPLAAGSSGSGVQSSDSEAALYQTSAATSTRAPAKFWGFWGSAISGAGNGNYIAESAALGSNTVMIREDDPQILRAKLALAKSHGQFVILFVQNVLFPWNSSALHANYRERFESYWKQISGYEDYVVGFYLFDEPYHNNSSAGWTQVYEPFLRNILDEAAVFLKSRHPQKKTFVTFTHGEVMDARFKSVLNPTSVDVIGVNCYLAFGEVCSETELYRIVHTLQLEKAPQQKIIITADGYWGSDPSKAQDLLVAKRIRFWKMLAASYGDVIAFFPFLYQNVPAENLFGLQSMPNALSEVSVYFNGLNGNVVCDVDDLVNVQRGQVVERWVKAPMCQPQCERGDLVRRTVKGELVERWVGAPMCAL